MTGNDLDRLRASPLFLRETEVRRGAELMFFGATRLLDALDATLAAEGLGRAHHRALYAIAREPGLTVGRLLRLLDVTKQSIGRILADLSAKRLIESGGNDEDRRQRLLRLTPAGQALEARLFAELRAALAKGYERAGQDAVTGFWRVLAELASPEQRAALSAWERR